MRVAIVGAGVSGLVAARMLHQRHDITVFEAGERAGGHANTIEIDDGGRRVPVDTGFIVFNERTYPWFCRVLRRLGVAWRATEMGFSVSLETSGVEYCGRDLDGLFAQRRNLLSPRFWRMLGGVLRFYRDARETLGGECDMTLGEYLARRRYSAAFVDDHLVPMSAAIWSADPVAILDFPVQTMVRFFANHGMLSLTDRPRWQTIVGGSRAYVHALIEPFRDRVHLRAPVSRITRDRGGPRLRFESGAERRFDALVLAVHADTALRLLADADALERAIVGEFPYQANSAVLHRDPRVMPLTRKAWSAWNYRVPTRGSRRPTVTYWMDHLQRLETRSPVFVTLNRDAAIDPARVLYRTTYDHPVFTAAAIRAQARRLELQGRRDTYWCGAYWGYGFHEDGCRSGIEVGEALGASFDEALGSRVGGEPRSSPSFEVPA